MGSEVGEVEEPWLIRLLRPPIQETQSCLGLHSHSEAPILDEPRSIGEGAAIKCMRGIGFADLTAPILVKALTMRHMVDQRAPVMLARLACFRAKIEVPFPDLSCEIARGFEPFCESQFGEGQSSLRIVFQAEALLVPPGEHASTGWHTLRGTDIASSAAHSVPGEGIQMGGADVFVDALDSQIGPAVIVRVNDEHIGLRQEQGRGEEESEQQAHGGGWNAALGAQLTPRPRS
jgi:hypothetical protein